MPTAARKTTAKNPTKPERHDDEGNLSQSTIRAMLAGEAATRAGILIPDAKMKVYLRELRKLEREHGLAA